MKHYELTYHPFGNRAILIEWPQEINEDILNDITAFKNVIEQDDFNDIEEVVPAYASLTLFLIKIKNEDKTIERLKELYIQRNSFRSIGKIWKIPVCYDLTLGIDLKELTTILNLSIEEIIYEHSSSTYLVHFIGFLPGFLYLGGLNPKLHCARKSTPRLNIDKGAVGIGGSQTGIYPMESPGGWNIIGKTPIQFFDKEQSNPCFAKPGDKIRFEAISLSEYDDVLNKVSNGNYSIEEITA
ncbi:MAG: 5-oxoprolinase subunit PxpB [Cyclobacteriaceae bacterium]|jgi:inhibitor of KinA|nr:5-oxoprolinase subunit PxpB [Cyclobacteriaceae bacterium]